MSDSKGALCIVLHAHLPHVLHHGHSPHGEAWLYEAAAETYLPLLEIMTEMIRHHARPSLTIGLTPVLLEQLAHDRFKTGFVAYLNEPINRATSDKAAFDKSGEGHLAALAELWMKFYTRHLTHFEKINRDIPARFALHWRDGQVQLLTSNATHAYMPLLVSDESARAQMSAGAATSERHLGRKSRGMWLPECAYRPAIEAWKPAVLWHDPRYRPGVEKYAADVGIDHFFVDTHSIANAKPLGTLDHGAFNAASESQVHWDKHRAWLSPMAPFAVSSTPGMPRCFAMARHPGVSEQVWSNIVGYPSSGAYLDFHHRHGHGGLRYHSITEKNLDAAKKKHYAPELAFVKLYKDAKHFCQTIREALAEHEKQFGRPGVVTATFDAELFGHWWHEGMSFLRAIIYIFTRDKSVKLVTAEEALEQYPPSTVVRLPEGSWGKNGDHTVWLNDQTHWMWEVEYRAESRMLGQLRHLPWQTNQPVADMLKRAGRQLLLLQASDWPFAIHSKGAVDYGFQRFSGHATNFSRLCTIADSLAAGRPIDPVQQAEIDEADAHDNIFAEIDLGWWSGKP
jgi:1,4-alpha-glucan branching enzyme